MWNTRESLWRSQRTTNCWTYWDQETQCHLLVRMCHGLFEVTNKLVLCVLLEGWRLINQRLKWQGFNLPALVYFPRSLKLWPTEAKAIRFFSKLCLVPVTSAVWRSISWINHTDFVIFLANVAACSSARQFYATFSDTVLNIISKKKIITSACSLPVWFGAKDIWGDYAHVVRLYLQFVWFRAFLLACLVWCNKWELFLSVLVKEPAVGGSSSADILMGLKQNRKQ